MRTPVGWCANSFVPFVSLGYKKKWIELFVFLDIGQCNISPTYLPFFNASTCPVGKVCMQVNWIYHNCSGKSGDNKSGLFQSGQWSLTVKYVELVSEVLIPFEIRLMKSD